MKVGAVLLWFLCLPLAVPGQNPPNSGTPAGEEWRKAVLAGLEEADRWKPFTSQEADFSVRLPGVPTRTLQTNAQHESVLYNLQDGKKLYCVARQGYKTDVAKTGTAEQLLDRGCDGILNAMKGKLVSKEAVTLEKYPGREMRFASGQVFFRLRAYWAAPNMYLVMVRGDQESVAGTDAAVFLNSFRIKSK